ncbi:GNAT family N-acetyltransferase [Macrococcoides canis]|nr:GNAT family N-acetyltransferase [Macrococcus canis]
MYRKIKKDEVPQLVNFTYLALYVAPGQKAFDKDIVYSPEISKYYMDFDNERELCFVCQIDEKLVGAVWGRQWLGDIQGYGFFSPQFLELTISILPDYRGRGIGTKLLELFISEVRRLEFKGLSLSVSHGNRAKNIYEKFGFKVVELRDDDILMVLPFK